MIYEWRNPNLKYARYIGATKQDERQISWNDPVMGDPLPSLETWEKPTLKQYLGEKGKERKNGLIGDAVSSASVHFISKKAKDALSDIWEKYATLYPVILDDVNEYYYMVVLNNSIDCIDREKSEGVIQKYGKHKGKGYFASLHKWSFIENKIGDNMLFTLPDNESIVYVTSEFKKRVNDSELTGFGFLESPFDENPFIS